MIVRLCAALAVTLVSLPGFALDNPLGVFSKETSLVLRASSPTAMSAKTKAFLEQAAPRFAPIADQIAPAMGSMIQNQRLLGVNAKRDWYLAVMFRADEGPLLIFAIPTNDVEAFQKALGEGVPSRVYEDWLVYSLEYSGEQDAKEAIDNLPEMPLGDGESILAAMDEAAAKMFASGELSLFVNLPAVRKTYQKQIDEFRQKFEQGAEEVSDDPQALAGMKDGRKMLEIALGVLKDSTGLAMNVAIQDDAIVSEAVFIVEPESESGQFLAKQKPSNFPLLEKLPVGSLAYVDVAGGLDELVKFSVDMVMNLPDSDEKSEEAMKTLLSFNYEEAAMAFEMGDLQQGAYQGVGLARLESAEGSMEAIRGWGRDMRHTESNGFQLDITWQPEAETIAGVPVDVVRTVMTIDPQADPGGNMNQMMKLFLGEEGMTQRVAVVENIVVQSVGGKEQMAEVIQSIKGEAEGGETAATALAGLQKKLSGQGQMLIVYDMPRIAASFLKLMIESGLAPFPPMMGAALEDLKLTPSYGGTLISIDGHRIHFREIIPAEQVKGLIDLGTALQQAGQGN